MKKKSKPSKPITRVQHELKRIKDDGFNIYPLLYKLKKRLKWDKDRNFPESVILNVCASYWKKKPKGSAWAWFIKAISDQSSRYFAEESIRTHEKFKRESMPQSIKDILKRL